MQNQSISYKDEPLKKRALQSIKNVVDQATQRKLSLESCLDAKTLNRKVCKKRLKETRQFLKKRQSFFDDPYERVAKRQRAKERGVAKNAGHAFKKRVMRSRSKDSQAKRAVDASKKSTILVPDLDVPIEQVRADKKMPLKEVSVASVAKALEPNAYRDQVHKEMLEDIKQEKEDNIRAAEKALEAGDKKGVTEALCKVGDQERIAFIHQNMSQFMAQKIAPPNCLEPKPTLPDPAPADKAPQARIEALQSALKAQDQEGVVKALCAFDDKERPKVMRENIPAFVIKQLQIDKACAALQQPAPAG
ncbi:MAG: hypothetical protein V6Z78_01395 [Holosporaceae bacterium]